MTLPTPRFLGQGWSFPPRFELGQTLEGDPTGAVAMVSGDADIRESLRILMLTLTGERLLLPDYGFGAEEHVFDPTDETTLAHLQSQIEDAIIAFEPRVKLISVDIAADEAADGVLTLSVDYFTPSINSRSNMVFPFYFREATSVRRK